jgi:hypothetical protein
MTRSRIFKLAILLAAAAGLFAQKIQAPLLAYVWDPSTAQLRPLWGSAGAAIPGEPIDAGESVFSAAVSPRQDYVFLLTGDSHEAALFDPKTAVSRKLPAVRPGASQIALSPDGSAAALYFDGAGLVQVIAGLPGAPAAPVDVFLPDLRLPLTRLAVTDDGSLLLIADASGEATAISTGPSRAHSRVVLSGPVTGAAFFPHSQDAIVSSETEVLRLSGPTRGILGPGLPGPVSIAVSSDGGVAVLAAKSGKVRVFHPREAEAPAVDLDCACAPGEITRMNGRAAFRLSGDASPALSLDAGNTRPQLSIIPLN